MPGLALPDGFNAGPAPSPATPAPLALPDGFTAGAASAPAASQPTPSNVPQGWPAVAANAATGLLRGVGNLLGSPEAIGSMLATDKSASPIPDPAALAAKLPSPSTINNWLFGSVVNPAYKSATGQQSPLPYTPQTTAGQIGQDVLSTAIPSAVGGLPGLATRLAAGAGSAVGSDLVPEGDYWTRLASGLAGALFGGGVGAGAGRLATVGRQAIAPRTPAESAVASQLATAAGTSGADLAATINQNLPGWTEGARPTLGAVTGNPGINNLVYNDQAAAARAGNPIYQTNAGATNAAQRAAIAGVTPDATQKLQTLAADRDTAVNAIPAGLTAQQAGQQFRQNLQGVYDQRLAARSAGGSDFDALESSPARINLAPVMDYARLQAAGAAGEVGQAYQRALGQFQSATGITLDTAPFANTVLKGLGDLQASYPAGSAAARAVGDVKGRLESSLADQAPEISAARQQWAANSRPLDVFQTKPFAQVLATDRFGRSYAMPNDAVASAFLRGNGSADSLDALNGIFGDPEAATRGLQDFLAGQVRQNALRADGTIDAPAMQRTLAPYQRALVRFPQLAQQFKTAAGAQTALDAQQAYQRLYETFAHGLGTMQHDAAGNPMYSAAQFDRAVQQHQGDLVGAYGQAGADAINRVNDELGRIAQTAYARVPGQSGTPQAMATGAGHRVGGVLAKLGGSLLGTVVEHLISGHGSYIGPYAGSLAGEFLQDVVKDGRFQNTVDQLRRQALTDPSFAQSLLTTYNPGAPTGKALAALRYVNKRLPVVTLPGVVAGNAAPGQP